jgi:(S)-ureidoglycine aminohydrolase
MRNPDQLVHSRARIEQRYAVFPLEGYPLSHLPGWQRTDVRVLAGPRMGAEFAEYLLEINPGGGGERPTDGRVENFFYLLDGEAELRLTGGAKHHLTSGSYALIPHSAGFALKSDAGAKALWLQKVYESAVGVEPGPAIVSTLSKVPALDYMGNPKAKLQTLIPDDLSYDMAMNIFTFDPGQSLPVVETHVMEHGLYFLQGKGLYYLDGDWMEVEKDDFLWMGPYCPQSFYATGPAPSKYLYYKNVNREIPL